MLPFAHRGRESLDEPESGADIGLKLAQKLGFVEFVERHIALHGSIQHEDVERRNGVADLFDQGFDAGRVRQIAGDRNAAACAGGLAQHIALPAAVHQHPRAGPRKRFRNRTADAAARTGHQRGPAGEVEHR